MYIYIYIHTHAHTHTHTNMHANTKSISRDARGIDAMRELREEVVERVREMVVGGCACPISHVRCMVCIQEASRFL